MSDTLKNRMCLARPDSYFALIALLTMLAGLFCGWNAQAAETEQMSLPDAINYALAHNPDLSVAEGQIDEAKQAEGEVFANYLPHLALEGGYTYISNVPEMNISFSNTVATPLGVMPININRTIEMGQHDNYKAQLTATQTLFASGQVYYADQAMEHQVRIKEFQTDAARLKVAQMTAEAYLGVLISQSVYQAQKEALNSAQTHLQQVQNRYDAGAASRFELLRAQVQVDNIAPQVTEAEKMIDQARTGLARAMGYSGALPALTDTLDTSATAVNVNQALDAAQKARPEFAALAAGREAYENQALSRRGGMLPTVVLNGTWGYQKPYYQSFDWEQNWTVGVGIRIPIFDGLQAYRGMTGAWAKAETVARSTDQTRADVRSQVTSATLDLQEAAVRIKSTQANVERAKEAVTIAENSYIAGAATNLEVIDAQLAATNARIANLKALYDYRVARVRLNAATGDREAIGR